MAIKLQSLRHHRWLASLAVLAFALRALIPAGFMPEGNGHLALQICPDGFPAALLAASGDHDHAAHAGHHHQHPDQPGHDHRSWTSGHCVFSAVAAAPPISHSPAIAVAAEVATPGDSTYRARVSLDIRFRIAQPRAPPHLA